MFKERIKALVNTKGEDVVNCIVAHVVTHWQDKSYGINIILTDGQL
jgi:hypothetical protein